MIEETGKGLIIKRPPEAVIEEAKQAAKVLKNVMELKKKKVVFGGEQYLEYEDWQTLAGFYGITAKVVSTNPVNYGEISGFSARAVALNAEGVEISGAEADCLNDEDKWRSRPKYRTLYVLKDGSETEEDPPKNKIVWERTANGKYFPKKRKEFVENEAVPLFQLKSMAQTRACAKALRNVLAWVAVLAGYKPTPAEELDGLAEVIPTGTVKEAEKEIEKPFIEPQPLEGKEESDIPEFEVPVDDSFTTEKEGPGPVPAPKEDKPSPPPAGEPVKINDKQIKAINLQFKRIGIDDVFAQCALAGDYLGLSKVPDSLNELTEEQGKELIKRLNQEVKKKQGA